MQLKISLNFKSLAILKSQAKDMKIYKVHNVEWLMNTLLYTKLNNSTQHH